VYFIYSYENGNMLKLFWGGEEIRENGGGVNLIKI
jgi:hypothetical protein